MRLSEALSRAAVKAGLEVRISESHGGAQRGGVATGHIRIGYRAKAPVIPARGADAVVGMEVLEAARSGPRFIRPGGVFLVNPISWPPLGVLTGRERLPAVEELVSALRKVAGRLYVVPATEMADRLGRRILANVVMLGALVECAILPFDARCLEDALMETVPAGTEDANREAFAAGRAALREAMER